MSVLRWLPKRLSNLFYDAIALNRYRLFGRYATQQPIRADYPGRFLSHQA